MLNPVTNRTGTSPMAPNNPWNYARNPMLADDVDFAIKGHDLQFVEIELDPGESAVGEAGAMVWKDACIEMTTVFGDGSEQADAGIMGKLMGAGKRLLSGATMFTTVFTHRGSGKARVAFGAPIPGTVMPVRLSDIGGTLICQKDSFLCAARGVSIGVAFQQRIMTGLFGGDGFVMQRLDGDGWVFVQMGGTLIDRELRPGEEIHVDTGCLAALTATVTFDVVTTGGVKSMLFGGEGVFFARLTGPGKVWIQSLPFSRLAGRMLAAATPGGGNRRGEGGMLGALGDFIERD
jgi:uncharacterized protein (AIM24 family)